jgi:hypothetical protein
LRRIWPTWKRRWGSSGDCLREDAVADSGHQELVYIGLDVAASEISVGDSDDKDTLAYRYTLRPGQPPLSSAELVAIYEVLRCCQTYRGRPQAQRQAG